MNLTNHPVLTATEWRNDLLDGLPDHILRTFACDCSERALLRKRASSREPDPSSWNAVRVARLFVEGKASKAELEEAASSAAWAARSAAWAADLAAWAAAYLAARSAAWGEAYAKERAWQLARLQSLYREWQSHQSSLLSLLVARGEAIEQITDKAKEIYEEVLF